VKQTHDYVRRYRGYWWDGGRCRFRIYREEGGAPAVVCSQPPDNDNTSVTNIDGRVPGRRGRRTAFAAHPLIWI
jgi:hypothetical protein